MNDSPCYNRETKTDCPNRSAGCAINCERWAKYVSEREEIYKARKVTNEEECAIYDMKRNRSRLNNRRKMYERTRK